MKNQKKISGYIVTRAPKKEQQSPKTEREILSEKFEKLAKNIPKTLPSSGWWSPSTIKQWAIGNDYRARAVMLINMSTGYPNLKIPSGY